VLSSEFSGTKRYALRRRLGAGGTGIVFAAFDRERGVEVALKLLRRVDADGILQIKREFRSLAEVSHPNLVGLYELVSAGRDWFFTMELVDGRDFRSWVWNDRLGGDTTGPSSADGQSGSDDQISSMAGATGDVSPGPVTLFPPSSGLNHEISWSRSRSTPRPLSVLGYPRLRLALRQLAQAVDCVHGAGKLHRDIKPNNVLISPEGRLVLLDFGLVRPGPLHRQPAGLGFTMMSGTPDYMAPEQAIGLAATAASDWYAIGVMLYEVLLGRLPFAGDVDTVIHQKRTRKPANLLPLVPEEARDLADLAMRLLARDPGARPSADDILRTLGVIERGGLIASSMPLDERGHFVGRDAQLAALHDAFHASAGGRTVVTIVRGRSGIGKSALCRRFIEDLRQQNPDALTLQSRCYERESVPHKVLDGVVDALVGEVASWSPDAREAIIPEDGEALVRLFPALRELWQGLDRGQFENIVFEPRTLRRRATAALGESIRRLAQRRPLVIHIDDLQWGDLDGAKSFADLLSRGGRSPVLWIVSYRIEDEERSEALVAFRKAIAACDADVRRLDVEPLSLDECSALVLRLLGRQDAEAHDRAKVLAQEAEGSPIFASELARFESAQASGRSCKDGQTATLEQLLRTRVSLLPEPARRLLARVAVAGRPLRQRILRCAGEEASAIFTLRNANLVRASGVQDDDTIETYHDRIRELIVTTLSPTELRQSHADLSQALQGVISAAHFTPSDLEAIAYHSLGAGDEEAALQFSLLAARQAGAVFASREAIRHFETALSLLRSSPAVSANRQSPPVELHEIEIEAAEACRLAGLYPRALELLTCALEAADNDERRAQICVSRGRVYQEKADTLAAVRDLEKALTLLGHAPPRDASSLVAGTAKEIVRFGIGRRSPFRSSQQPAMRDRTAIAHQADVLFVLMRIYYFVDMPKLVWAGFAAMNLAEESGRAVTRAQAEGYFGVVLLGVGWCRRAARHCETAVRLAAGAHNRAAEGAALGRLGTVALFENRLDVAVDVLHRSVAALRGVSETWELLTSLMLEATAHFMAGRLESAERLWSEMSVVARDVGGAMHLAWCLSWRPYVAYLRGTLSADEARRELDQASSMSESVHDIANQTAAQSHIAAICVREGDCEAAAQAARRLSNTLSRYSVQVPFLQIGLVDAAEAALTGLGAKCDGPQSAELRDIMQRSLRRLSHLTPAYPYLRAPAMRVEALAAAHFGKPDKAYALITKAVGLLEASPNRLWLASAYQAAATIIADRRSEFLLKAQQLAESLNLRILGKDSCA
jgi:serine/threonine protein kinase/tetratricopeptide (TPR) repeat protein